MRQELHKQPKQQRCLDKSSLDLVYSCWTWLQKSVSPTPAPPIWQQPTPSSRPVPPLHCLHWWLAPSGLPGAVAAERMMYGKLLDGKPSWPWLGRLWPYVTTQSCVRWFEWWLVIFDIALVLDALICKCFIARSLDLRITLLPRSKSIDSPTLLVLRTWLREESQAHRLRHTWKLQP